MFTAFFRIPDQENEILHDIDDETIYDEDLFRESIKTDPHQAKRLFTMIIKKQQHNRRIYSLATYYLGEVYESLHEPETATRYFHHIVLNYPDQKDLAKKADAKMKQCLK
ncbi:hypothetical protein KAR34_02115 [bacterium]|nr:hypothetical protein [bacterium]